MSGPIPPKDLIILLGCGSLLPFAAAFGTYPFAGPKRKILNIISFSIGLAAIMVVGVVLHQVN